MKISQKIATGLLVLASTSIHAALITQSGADVDFTYDDSTAYGTGTIIGNSIFFTPASMSASSADGAGIDTNVVTLNIDVSATTPGFNMSLFTLFEDGDYRLDGGTDVGGGASVDAQAFFRARSLTTFCGAQPCEATDLYSAGALADTGGALTLWSMGGTLNLAGVAGWGSDTDVRLTIQNNLTADTTAQGELAFIQKKFSIVIPDVPVPAAVWLFGSGLIGLIAVARRKVS